MIKTKLVFDILQKLSGLTVNLLKSELSVTSSSLSLVIDLAAAIQCKHAVFPIKYLGLPLSDKRLTKADYFPLVDKIQRSLAGWKAPLLSIGGRIILANSVLSAIPQFFMSMFMLPKWTLRKIDQIRRRFLWHGHKDHQGQKRGLYMVNWKLVTKPRCIGGLGIRDLQITNQALLMKWMWLWFVPQNEWWKRATITAQDSDRPWHSNHATLFWKNLRLIEPAFACSTTHQIGQGSAVSFWHDNWCGKPLKYRFPHLYQAAAHQFSSVQQNRSADTWDPQFQQLNQAAQIEKNRLLSCLQDVHIAPGRDRICWLRRPPSFSVSSAYLFLANAPSPQSSLANIWSIKAPLRVLVFAWLMLTNKLTTLDSLSRRGWHLPNMCIMCRQNEETVRHLFHTCLLAKEVRDYVFVAFAAQHSIPQNYKSENSFLMLTNTAVSAQARQWELATCFVLWRERCRRTFEGSLKQHISIVREIITEYTLWSFKAATHQLFTQDPVNPD